MLILATVEEISRDGITTTWRVTAFPLIMEDVGAIKTTLSPEMTVFVPV